jgi:hypothetical protein
MSGFNFYRENASVKPVALALILTQVILLAVAAVLKTLK